MLGEIFKGKCPSCGEASEIAKPLCEACIKQLKKFEVYCGVCGYPLVREGVSCQKCSGAIGSVKKVYSLYRYTGVIRDLLLDIKFNYNIRSSLTLEKLVELPELEGEYEAVIPVPSHILRRFRRFFHPADLLAWYVSDELGIMLDRNLKRKRYTTFQYKLGSRMRAENVKEAFVYKKERDYRNVLLVDDILTTGSTVNECAATLKKAGIKRVDCLTLCKG